MKVHKTLVILVLIVSVVFGIYLYNVSPVNLAKRNYTNLVHPDWSKSINIQTNVSISGASQNLYLVDVREVSVSVEDAIKHYQDQARLLDLKEFHADSYSLGKAKFSSIWKSMDFNIETSNDSNFVILSQYYEIK